MPPTHAFSITGESRPNLLSSFSAVLSAARGRAMFYVARRFAPTTDSLFAAVYADFYPVVAFFYIIVYIVYYFLAFVNDTLSFFCIF